MGEFELEQVVGTGGFGIVYLALDHSLMRHVAIKEYVPHALVTRDDGSTLRLRCAADAPSFDVGLRSFINEARLLAGLDHPSLLKVHRFWEENGTAYMAMPYYAGRTLKELRAAMTRAPDELWLQKLIHPLLGALEVLHAQRIFHRDISPDNIMILPDGRPILLDFGSARRVAGDAALGLTAILKPSFAPVEQYADTGGMPQGPWTDLYALGAVVYFMLKGEPPVPSVVRAMQGATPLLSAPDRAAAHACVTPSFLRVIDWALAVNPQDRPQSVTALRQALNGELPAPAETADAPTQPQPRRPGTRSSTVRGLVAARKAAVIAALALGSVALAAWTLGTPSDRPAVVPTAIAVDEPQPAASAARVTSADPARPRKPRTAVVAPRPPAAVDTSALDECAARNFVMKAICTRRACEQPQLRQHDQCRRLRAEDEARRQAEMDR